VGKLPKVGKLTNRGMEMIFKLTQSPILLHEIPLVPVKYAATIATIEYK